MSASSSPTFAPKRARPTARFTATVLLPTPPLPAPTAITCFTSGSGLPFSCTFSLALRTSAVNSISSISSVVPQAFALACTAASTSARILSFMGQAGVVSSITRRTDSPATAMCLTMPSVTRSLWISGS